MKRSFLALTLLALLLTPALIFPFYRIDNVHGSNPMCGAYYGGYSWLFYVNTTSGNETPLLTYYRMELSSNHQPSGARVVTAPTKNDQAFCVPYGCAVFDEALFVFAPMLDKNGFVYRFLHGTEKADWNDEWLRVKNTQGNPFPFSSDCGVAPVTFDGKLWLFGSTPEGGLCFVNSSDGINWGDRMYYPQDSGKHGYDAYLVWEYCNVAACPIVDKDGKEMAIIVWASPPPYGYIYSVLCDGENFFNYQRLPGEVQYPRGLGLAQGTRSGCGSGYYVQLFYVERDTPYKLRRKEYNVDHNTWSTGSEYFDYWYKFKGGWPAGLTAFARVGNNLEKEVWCIHLEEAHKAIYIQRFQSDHLVRLNPESQYCGDTTYRSLWNLVGVVEGPPPFVLNGRDLKSISEPSELEYGRSTQESAESSHENSIEIHVSVGGSKGGGADYRNALDENFCKDTTFEVETAYKVRPVVDSSYGYLAYLKPNVTRWQYKVNDYKGNYTGRDEYMFFISGANLQFVGYSMDTVPYSPNPHDITSYLHRDTLLSKYPRICTPVAMRWETGLREDVKLAGETEVSHSTKTTNSIEVHAGWADIFDIGVGETFSFEQTNTFTFGQYITVTLDCPPAESANHVNAFEMTAYWLMPDTTTDSAYWIPTGYMEGQKPWCVTWEVTRIEYLDGTVLTAVKEEEPAACLNLDVISPNPLPTGVTLSYSLPQTSPISLKIYDASGRLVKTLASGDAAAGEHSIYWDGRDERGMRLPSGVYFARLECGREQMMEKIVMLR